MTTDEINKRISIAVQELNLADTPDEKHRINKRIQKLKFELEIAIIRRKIEQLS